MTFLSSHLSRLVIRPTVQVGGNWDLIDSP